MKKNFFLLAISVLLILLSTSCTTDTISQDNIEIDSTQSEGDPSDFSLLYGDSSEADITLELDEWQEAYIVFLKNFTDSSAYAITEFSLRDLNNDNLPELIIIQGDGEINGVLTVYSFDEEIVKFGEYSDSKIGTAGLRTSNNTNYSGLFTFWWGGGVEYYGYISVIEDKLIYERLWEMDRTEDPPNQNEISNDKQLIDESINAHPPYEYTDNLLKMVPITDDNIINTIGAWRVLRD